MNNGNNCLKGLVVLIALGISACNPNHTTTTPDVQSMQPSDSEVNQAKLQKALTF